MRPKPPATPAERFDTLRQSILSLLRKEEMTALEISEAVGVSVRDVYGHLDHIRLSLQREGGSLTVLPAECRGCGFVFAKRDRLKRPGRCPVCRGESISQPRYRVRDDQ
ncbi:MAG: transcriptional regulator [Desulfuromonadales bacterium]|nr:transcriptional regulator [Desulfuromonadales bacterium]